MIFISRKQFLELFTAIDGILAEIDDLHKIPNSMLTKSLCKDNITANYVKRYYPDIAAIYRIIYDKYNSPQTIWENARGDIAYLAEPISKPRNRWREFKKFMQKQKSKTTSKISSFEEVN